MRERLTRRQFCGIFPVIPLALLASCGFSEVDPSDCQRGCEGTLGDENHPLGPDSPSEKRINELMAELSAHPNLHPDLQPFVDPYSFLEGPDIRYGIKRFRMNDDVWGRVISQTTKGGILYNRIYWWYYDYEDIPSFKKEREAISEQSTLIHELAHVKKICEVWRFFESQGWTQEDLVEKFFEIIESREFSDKSEPFAKWIEDLYLVTLLHDPTKAEVIKAMNYKENELFDRFAVVSCLIEQGLGADSLEYRWLCERFSFTETQAKNWLAEYYGKEAKPLPRLTIRDSELREDFVNCLVNPLVGGLRYQPGRVGFEFIDDHKTLVSRDMFETNPLIRMILEGNHP